jgi:hypothetical protein
MNKDKYNFFLKYLGNGALDVEARYIGNYVYFTIERDKLGIPSNAPDRRTIKEFKVALRDYLEIKESPLYNALREETNNDN